MGEPKIHCPSEHGFWVAVGATGVPLHLEEAGSSPGLGTGDIAAAGDDSTEMVRVLRWCRTGTAGGMEVVEVVAVRVAAVARRATQWTCEGDGAMVPGHSNLDGCTGSGVPTVLAVDYTTSSDFEGGVYWDGLFRRQSLDQSKSR